MEQLNLLGSTHQFQQTLMRTYYEKLCHANENKELTALLFIGGNIVELLSSFDIHCIYPEVSALQCGVKKISGEFISKAEDYGYSSDVCAYVKNDIGMLFNGYKGPFGQLPKPDFIITNYGGCNTYLKWFEALAHFWEAELIVLDIPFMRTGDNFKEFNKNDVNYVVNQLKELILFLEKKTAKKFDIDKLRGILKNSKKAEDLWVEVLNTAKNKPSPIESYFEIVSLVPGVYMFRGSEDAVKLYETASFEMAERVKQKYSPVEKEVFRMVIEGPPPWPYFRNFSELFKKWGAVCVASTYSKVGGIWDYGFRHDPARPLESIAEGAILCYCNLNWKSRIHMIEKYHADFSADCIIIHAVKSCRSFTAGQGDFREYFIKDKGILTLLVESDLEDPRYYSEAQMKTRIDAFFESLMIKKKVVI